MPLMNAVGMKTEQSTNAIATNAPPTSVIALRAASRGLRPSSMWCSIASTTTIASSTTMPMARTMPKSERLLIENPKPFIAANVPINEHDQRDRFEERLLHFMDRFADRNRRIVNNCVVESGREALLELGHLLSHCIGSRESV